MLQQLGPKELTEMNCSGHIYKYIRTEDGSQLDGMYLRSAPTAERRAATKMLLLCDQRVQVSTKLRLEGREWLKVSKPGGMEGWVPAELVTLEVPKGQSEDQSEDHTGRQSMA